MSLRKTTLVLALSAVLPACNPYNRSGEYYAGPVDPRDFPDAYKGAPNENTGVPEVFAKKGYVRDEELSFFVFPTATGASASSVLRLKRGETDRPVAYVFDPEGSQPFPATQKCKAPEGYIYDARRDFVRYDEQGSIFTALPKVSNSSSAPGAPAIGSESFSYTPILAEVPVVTTNLPCQDPKSYDNIIERTDVSFEKIPPKQGVVDAKATGKPDGKYLAWAVVDPTADVRLFDKTVNVNGLGPQKWGWFDHLLLAYIDGGYVPTKMVTVPGMNGNPPTDEGEAEGQILLVPNMLPDAEDPSVPPFENTDVGSGFDVLQYKRGDVGYSPICHVMFFSPPDPTNIPTDFAAVDPSAYATDTGLRVYCLQVQ